MSTFLELARILREDCGISGVEDTPVAVTGQAGEMRRVVNWIKRAYREVQEAHNNWDFLRFDFSFPTIATQQTYTRAGVTPALTELSRWKLDTFRCYLTSAGTIDEQWIGFVPWVEFRDNYLMTANRTVTERPIKFTIKPDKSVMLWPTPDAIYTITGEYWKRPQTLTANGDIPLIPEEFHEVLVGKGMEYYGEFEGAPEVFASGQARASTWMAKLETDQLPEIEGAGALA